jgi:hypothetical protein
VHVCVCVCVCVCASRWQADEVTLSHLVDHTGPQMHYVNGVPRSHTFPPVLSLISGSADVHLHRPPLLGRHPVSVSV